MGRSLGAHLCRSDSLFRMFLTTDRFLGVTQLPFSSLPTWDSVTSWKLARVEAVGGVGNVGVSGSGGSGKMSTSLARLAKATESIVWRSSRWWMLMAGGSSGSGIYLKEVKSCVSLFWSESATREIQIQILKVNSLHKSVCRKWVQTASVDGLIFLYPVFRK